MSMSTCQHSWRFLKQEAFGQDRIIKTFFCAHCPKTRTRNLKKPRFVPYAELLEREGTKSRKGVKTSQKPRKSQRKAIRKVSEKRQAQNSQYLRQRKAFLERRPYCEIERCGQPATEVHHGAGKEGEWLLREEFWWPTCRACHDKCEQNRAWARERGYLKLRLTTDQLNQQTK